MGLKELQRQVLGSVFKRGISDVSLAGGTALELFYLNHRNSRDLDFFLMRYDQQLIEDLIAWLSRDLGYQISKGIEFSTPHHARVSFYHLEKEDLETPLKIDFVEEILIPKPQINLIDGMRIYDVKDIYYHKIFTITGSRPEADSIGRDMFTGRNAPRDAVDIYYLSQKVCPLNKFLKEVPAIQQHLMVRWIKTYSRMDMKLEALDLEIYEENFDVNKMIRHLDDEMDKFVEGMM